MVSEFENQPIVDVETSESVDVPSNSPQVQDKQCNASEHWENVGQRLRILLFEVELNDIQREGDHKCKYLKDNEAQEQPEKEIGLAFGKFVVVDHQPDQFIPILRIPK